MRKDVVFSMINRICFPLRRSVCHLFPEDIHAPLISARRGEKLIIKVKFKFLDVQQVIDLITGRSMLPLYFIGDEEVREYYARYRAGIKELNTPTEAIRH